MKSTLRTGDLGPPQPPDAREDGGQAESLFLAGRIDAAGSIGELRNLFEVADATPAVLPAASPLILRLEAEAGRILAEYPLSLETSVDQTAVTPSFTSPAWLHSLKIPARSAWFAREA